MVAGGVTGPFPADSWTDVVLVIFGVAIIAFTFTGAVDAPDEQANERFSREGEEETMSLKSTFRLIGVGLGLLGLGNIVYDKLFAID